MKGLAVLSKVIEKQKVNWGREWRDSDQILFSRTKCTSFEKINLEYIGVSVCIGYSTHREKTQSSTSLAQWLSKNKRRQTTEKTHASKEVHWTAEAQLHVQANPSLMGGFSVHFIKAP